MARFASRYGAYKHQIRSGKTVVFEDGTERTTETGIFAIFDQTTLREDEIQQAIRRMVFTGRPIDLNTNELFNARHWVSGIDTGVAQDAYGWTDEERLLVESVLRKSHHFGSDHIEIEPDKAALPWNNYDELQDVETILAVLEATRMNPADVLAYERENQKRPEVIEAILALDAPDEPSVVIEA